MIHTPSVHIRQLGPDDAHAYRALRLRMLKTHPDAFTSSYEEDVQRPLSWVRARLSPASGDGQRFVLGAFGEDMALAGSVGLSAESRKKQSHRGHLFGMFVAPESMGRGIGRALLSECVARARGMHGLEQIHLTFTATNLRVGRMYEAAGFRRIGIEERAIRIDGVYFPKAHMVLYLREQDARQDAAEIDGGTQARPNGNCEDRHP